jgi:hypothetical protein
MICAQAARPINGECEQRIFGVPRNPITNDNAELQSPNPTALFMSTYKYTEVQRPHIGMCGNPVSGAR